MRRIAILIMLLSTGFCLADTLDRGRASGSVPDACKTKWNAKSRDATSYVASSTATDNEKNAADYLCDGTRDDTEILAAFAIGGKVQLSTGTFYPLRSLQPDTNTIFGGCGADTQIIKPDYVGASLTANGTAGNNYVDIADTTGFVVGNQVLIYSDTYGGNNASSRIISDVNSTRITFSPVLVYNYTMAANAVVCNIFTLVDVAGKTNVTIKDMMLNGNKVNRSSDPTGEFNGTLLMLRDTVPGVIGRRNLYTVDNVRLIDNRTEGLAVSCVNDVTIANVHSSNVYHGIGLGEDSQFVNISNVSSVDDTIGYYFCYGSSYVTLENWSVTRAASHAIFIELDHYRLKILNGKMFECLRGIYSNSAQTTNDYMIISGIHSYGSFGCDINLFTDYSSITNCIFDRTGESTTYDTVAIAGTNNDFSHNEIISGNVNYKYGNLVTISDNGIFAGTLYVDANYTGVHNNNVSSTCTIANSAAVGNNVSGNILEGKLYVYPSRINCSNNTAKIGTAAAEVYTASDSRILTYNVSGTVAAYDVVANAFSAKGEPNYCVRTTTLGDPKVLGVCLASSMYQRAIKTHGIALVKTVCDNDVNIGDWLGTSTTTGAAIKVADGNTAFGYAMQADANTVTENIQCFITGPRKI